MPARDLARIKISEVLDQVRASGEVLRPGSMRDVGLEAVDALLRERDAAIGSGLAGISLADLCVEDAEEMAQPVPPSRHTD